MSADALAKVMDAQALKAAQASATELKTFIAQTRGELRRVMSALEAETSLGSLQLRAVESTRLQKLKILSDVAGRTPAVDTVEPFPYTGALVTQRGAGWTLNPALEQAFEGAVREARINLLPQAKKTLSDRLFRDVDGTRERALAASIETMCRIVASLTSEARRLEAAARDQSAQRKREADALRQAAENRLNNLLNTYAAAQSRLPAPLQPWANEAWSVWLPAQLSGDVFAGRLRPRQDPSLGAHADFGRDVMLPLYVRPTTGLHLITQRPTRAATQALVRALLLRALAAHAPGTLQLMVFDPVGLGQSVAPLLELSEYDQDLLGGKVWSSASDFESKMTEITAHVELVVQKFLRSDYVTLAEFNAAAGEIATPYRLLVVFDFPTHFDQESFDNLCRVIETGPRCGVGTLLVTNGDAPLPHGVDLSRLPKTTTRINMASPFSFQGPNGYQLVCDFEPDSDQNASSAVITRIVESIGATARDRSAQSVGFEKVFRLFSSAALEGKKRGLPRITTTVDPKDPASWWSQTTLESVAAPIGLRGARDVATLSFDSSEHAGALLVGRPGSGKSTLLHTFIAGITTMYGPDELELHLIDF